uniref:39S ribosomal protein L37, mitochondrial n=1 Tax=Phallusia mammillata TaxID=59560 RepID=A0A6F9DLY0_9ASCI|nr:39S ribosomal protein L37, mitochondrial [Phallusia mammillata]
MNSVLPKQHILFVQNGIQSVFAKSVSPSVVIPCRKRVYYGSGKHKGGMIGRYGRRKYPPNWRAVNFNPAQIPKAWKPLDWDEKNRIDYEYESKLAQYIPGYKPKVPPHRREDHHDEPMHAIDNETCSSYGFPQALALTKSVVVEGGLPAKLQELQKSLPNPEDKVIKIMQNALLFDVDPCMVDTKNAVKRYKFDNFRHPTPERYCPRILKEFVRLCDAHICRVSDKYHDRFNMQNLPCKTWFQRAEKTSENVDILDVSYDWKVSIDVKTFMQLLSKNPLSLFATPDEVEETKNRELVSIYPKLLIHSIKPTHNYTPEHTTGFLETWHKPHLHTMVLNTTNDHSSKKTMGRMLFHLFCALHSRAVQQYGETPQVLAKPLAAQAIASDGRQFYAMTFQLNTTDLKDDSGVKNMVWTSAPLTDDLQIEDQYTPTLLFDECSPLLSYYPDYYHGYSPDAFATFQALWLNDVL